MNQGHLSWTTAETSGALVASPSGRIDENSVATFAEKLSEALGNAAELSAKCLVIDLTGVEYLSSRGLRALTVVQRNAQEHNVRLELARPGQVIKEILEISRYDKLFDIHSSVEKAVNTP